MESPLVSVIITTYNGNKKWLAESINSILNQTYKNIEIIIINDASTNDIEKTIKEYQTNYNYIIYLKNKKKLGCSKSSNKGIRYSKGKYIARIDDDDIRNDRTKIEKQITFMEKNIEYGLCGTEYTIIINEEGKKIDEWKYITSDKDIRNHILQANQFTHSSIVFRKESLVKVGLYNEEYHAALDYEIICKVGSKFKFCNIEGLSVTYRINTNGITKKKHSLQYKNALKVFYKNRNNFPNFFSSLCYRIIDLLLPKTTIKILNNIIKNLILKFR